MKQKGFKASTIPKPAKADPATIISPADFISGGYAARIAAGELSISRGMDKIVAVTKFDDDLYEAKTRAGETIYLYPAAHLVIGLPHKPFVRTPSSPFSTPSKPVEAVYQDAPGAFTPPTPGAPHPGNVRATAILRAVCERRSKLQKKLRTRMGNSPIEARERLLEKIKEEAA